LKDFYSSIAALGRIVKNDLGCSIAAWWIIKKDFNCSIAACRIMKKVLNCSIAAFLKGVYFEAEPNIYIVEKEYRR
jgi:hypothetical protein